MKNQFIIAQLTDLHIVQEGELCQDHIPTYLNLRKAVTHLNKLRPIPDIVLITGDLAEYGSPAEYELLRTILNQLVAPYFIVPGNHDRRKNLLEAFADHSYLPEAESKHVLYAIDDYPVRLIGLDTALFGEPYGRLCNERLEWLEKTLAAAPDTPTLIFMHHPPFRTGIRWIDAAGLYGGRQMETIISQNPQVTRIICGHVHRSIQTLWGGTIVSTAPSSSHAQLALNLAEENGYDFTYSLEPWSLQLLQWDSHYGLISHSSHITDKPELYAPQYAADLKDRFRKLYQEFCASEYEANLTDDPN